MGVYTQIFKVHNFCRLRVVRVSAVLFSRISSIVYKPILIFTIQKQPSCEKLQKNHSEKSKVVAKK